MNRCEVDPKCRARADLYIAIALDPPGPNQKRAYSCPAHVVAYVEAWTMLPDAVRAPIEIGTVEDDDAFQARALQLVRASR